MGMATPLYLTVEDLRAFPPDRNRYELVHGELLVTPAPAMWHEVLVNRLLSSLIRYTEEQSIGIAFSRSEIEYGRHTHFEPDIMVVSAMDVKQLDWAKVRRPLLIVEVISSSSTRIDRFTKRVEYLRQGVEPYWVVDGEKHLVEVWSVGHESPIFAQDRLRWHPEGVAAPFQLDLPWLFRAP